jgi:hypothetical protein
VRLWVHTCWLKVVPTLLVGGPAKNSLSVNSCHHFHEKFLFERSSWNYILYFSVLDVITGLWAYEVEPLIIHTKGILLSYQSVMCSDSFHCNFQVNLPHQKITTLNSQWIKQAGEWTIHESMVSEASYSPLFSDFIFQMVLHLVLCSY